MEHMSSGARKTGPQLDEALIRGIRQLIAEAIETAQTAADEPAHAEAGDPEPAELVA
jgi:hypothetical protein